MKEINHKFTRVWKIDGHLVVADTVEDAVKLMRDYYAENSFYEPVSIEGVSAGGPLCSNYDALIKKD